LRENPPLPRQLVGWADWPGPPQLWAKCGSPLQENPPCCNPPVRAAGRSWYCIAVSPTISAGNMKKKKVLCA